MALASLGKNGLLGKERHLNLVFKNAECMPGLPLGPVFVMEVSDPGAMGRGQQLMVKVVLLAQLEGKPSLVGHGLDFPCWH